MDEPVGPAPPPVGVRLEEAERQIGTSARWREQILYPGAELGLFCVLDADPTGASEIASERSWLPESD